MHNRQRGAAHVPIMFFLILLVMFLGALGFAYVTVTKNGELIKQRDAAILDATTWKNRDLLIQHYVADVGAVIGKPGKYDGRRGAAGSYQGATLPYEGLMNPEELKRALDEACVAAEVSVSLGLQPVLDSLVQRIKDLKAAAVAADANADAALTAKKEVEASLRKVTDAASQKAAEFTRDLEQTRKQFDSAKAEHQARFALSQENLNAKSVELTSEKERAVAKEKELENRISRHQMQNSALVARDAMRNPPDAADGKILVAKNGIPSAFINLGRKDMLQPGTVFRVKNPNQSAVKGYATVKRVEEERAEVELSNFADPIGDYAKEGDLLFNELYTPRVTRTIYLMGRFTAPYQKDQLTSLLRRLGNKVVDKMQPGVDTVILGNDPINEAGDGFASVQESEEFKLASELRVEFSYLATIRDLIKL